MRGVSPMVKGGFIVEMTRRVERREAQRHRSVSPSWVSIFLCLSLFLLLTAPALVSAQSPALLRLRPASVEISVGESIIVEIVVSNVVDLYAVDVQILFDPDVLRVKDANPSEEGVQVQPGSLLFPDLLVRNEADNETGKIWFALTQLNPRDPVSGEGTLALVEFTGYAPGTSRLLFAHHLLGNRSGEAIEAVREDGEIVVTEESAAPTGAPTDTHPRTIPAPTDTPQPTEASTSTPSPLPPTEEPTRVPTPTSRPSQPTAKPTKAYPGPAATQLSTLVPSATPTREKPTDTPPSPTSTPEKPTDTPTIPPVETAPPATSTAAVVEEITPTRPLPTTRRVTTVTVPTPTMLPESKETGGLVSIAAYGLLMGIGISLLFWFRRGR